MGKKQPADRCWGYVLVGPINNSTLQRIGLYMDLGIRHFLLERKFQQTMNGSEGMTSVIIRTPDQRVKDLTIECQPEWTVANLKHHLSQLYPGNPKEDKQRLILAGKLLQDKTNLDELFKTYDFQPIIHFVCTQTPPLEPTAVSESEPTTVSSSSSRSTVSANSQPAGEPARQPVQQAHLIGHNNTRWGAHVNHLNMWYQQLEQNQEAGAVLYAPHLTEAVLRRNRPQQEVEENEEEAQPAAAAPVPAPPAPIDPEDQHDLLDVFYLIIRALFLLALVWNYASPARFCFMGVFLFYMYLYHAGYVVLPQFFTRDTIEATTENGTPVQLSRMSVLKNALISFISSLFPSYENNN